MNKEQSTLNTRKLFSQADQLVGQKSGLFKAVAGQWFDDFTQSEAWRQRRHHEIKSLEKEQKLKFSEARKRRIENIQERLKDKPSFILQSHEAWQAITTPNPRRHLRIIYLFWLLHRKHIAISSFENYPFKDIWDNPDNPEYEDEAARSAIFDANPENYQIVKESIDEICSQNDNGKAEGTKKIKSWTVKLANEAIQPVIRKYGKKPSVLTARFLEEKTGCPHSTLIKTENWVALKNIKKNYMNEQGKMQRKPVTLSNKTLSIAEQTQDGTVKLHTSHKKKILREAD
ncbi:MAG: hypothetical protein KAS75_04700 [Planctomycetes bacterium]|nr:hypothetical protein [Planctomycetota bacterium]